MATMTIRVSESKHARLKQLASRHGLSLNKLFEEWSNIAIAQADAEARFISRATKGNAKKGLALLEKLDNAFKKDEKS